MADATGAMSASPGPGTVIPSVMERIRRFVAMVELIIFVLPVAIVIAEYVVFMGVYPLVRADRAALPAMDLTAYLLPLGMVLVGSACLVAGVRIVIAFLMGGHEKLRQVSMSWWLLASLGALLSMVSRCKNGQRGGAIDARLAVRVARRSADAAYVP